MSTPDPTVAQVSHSVPHPHVAPLTMYYKVFASLIALTAITVGVSEANLGTASAAVAVTVAVIKATLVAVFFMHLLWDERFNALIFVGSLIFLAIFFVITFLDIAARDQIEGIEDNLVVEQQQLDADFAAQRLKQLAPPPAKPGP